MASFSQAPTEPESSGGSDDQPAPAQHPDQQAGQDTTIAERLEQDPSDADAKLDRGLDESMDASDPPAAVQPGDHGDPVPSSGFDPAAEAAIAESSKPYRPGGQRLCPPGCA